MKGLLKNLGLILILVGAVILVACSFTGNVNNNAILGTSAVLIVIGLISYSYQQENCGLIPRKRNKKRRLHCNRLFFIFHCPKPDPHQDSASGVISLYPFP